MKGADHITDIVVVGSGGGACVAALTAKLSGLDALVVEKTGFYGGSTALSGGGMWIPNNHKMAAAGIYDSFDLALGYMQQAVGDCVSEARLAAYVRYAPEMLAFLCENTAFEVQIVPNSADYYDLPGSITSGRSVEAAPFNGKLLGEQRPYLLPPQFAMPGGVGFTIGEFLTLTKFKTTGAGRRQALKAGVEATKHLLARRERLTMGQALIARLRYAMLALDIPLWLDAPARKLLVREGRVAGVEIDRQGERLTVQANKGVILAAGGFGQNQEMREQYLPHPTSAGWSTAYEGNTGDAIRMGLEIGADVELMDDAWWGSVYVPPEGAPFFTVMERQSPGSIIVNQAGRRFVNEAIAYTDFVHAVYEEHWDGELAIPFYFIMDQRCRNNYMFGLLMPRQGFPDEYYAAGLVKKADTVAELARQIDVDPQVLEQTVERFSGYARGGKDQEFRKGETPFEHVYADPARWPNPCLAPIDQPPFYAVTMYPGDLGTKGGLLTDEYARVLGEDGSVIGGLYATGNTAASVMGNAYAGAGGTIGPAMAFGYVAVRHLADALD